MIPDGATIMCGGFLACGQARAIVKELVALGTKDLTLIANDMGRATGPMGEEFFGIAELIHNHQVKRVIATHVGMTPEVQAQCFDLFFSTKEVGEGTGLGLAVVHNIVTNHGGRIDLESAPGKGTRFRVILPRDAPVAEPPPAGAPPVAAAGTGGGASSAP